MNTLLLIVTISGFVIVLAEIQSLKCAILKAIGDRVDPARARQMTDDLRKSAEPLAKAVEDNKPISS